MIDELIWTLRDGLYDRCQKRYDSGKQPYWLDVVKIYIIGFLMRIQGYVY